MSVFFLVSQYKTLIYPDFSKLVVSYVCLILIHLLLFWVLLPLSSPRKDTLYQLKDNLLCHYRYRN